MWKEIIDAVSFLIAFIGSVFGVFKAFENWQQEKTKRAEIIAKETSVGAVALAAINVQLEVLQRAKKDDAAKLETINEAVKGLHFITDMIEKRMLSIFSGNK